MTVIQANTISDPLAPPAFVIRELARQLDSWHATLPYPLHWPTPEDADAELEDPTDLQRKGATAPSSSEQVETSQRKAWDVAVAQLQARFYYARFMLYRPFVYKALHTPARMSANDAYCCGIAIRSACQWPRALHSARDTKRLFPHLFNSTQTCLGILLIFRMTTKQDSLRAICDEYTSRIDVLRATDILLDWLRDVRQLDGIADWCSATLDELLLDLRV